MPRACDNRGWGTPTLTTSALAKVELPVALAPAAEKARDYARDALAANTRRAYRSDWGHFEAWCIEHGLAAMPAAGEAVALYLSAHAQLLKVSTLTRRLATLSQAHKAPGHPSPAKLAEVRAVMAGIRRARGTAPTQKAPPPKPGLNHDGSPSAS